MYKKKCDLCNKVIEGYNEKHVDYLLQQHKISKVHKSKEVKK